MKKIVWVFLLLMTAACSSPKKLFESGHYNEAMKLASERLEKKCCSASDLHFLNQSYHAANQIDYDRIIALKASGQPDIWPEVYWRTHAMLERENQLLSLPEQAREAIRFQPVDFATEESAARQKASMFLFSHATELMEVETTENAHEALRALLALQDLDPNFPQIDQQIIQALLAGSGNIGFRLSNLSDKPLPKEFAPALFNSLKNDRLPVSNRLVVAQGDATRYDLMITVNISSFEISPEKQSVIAYAEPGLDSMDKKAVADIKEITMEKTVQMNASMDFVVKNASQAVLSVPLKLQTSFNHNFAVIKGNQHACSQRVKDMAQQAPKPFPSDRAMLLQLAKDLGETGGSLLFDDMK